MGTTLVSLKKNCTNYSLKNVVFFQTIRLYTVCLKKRIPLRDYECNQSFFFALFVFADTSCNKFFSFYISHIRENFDNIVLLREIVGVSLKSNNVLLCQSNCVVRLFFLDVRSFFSDMHSLQTYTCDTSKTKKNVL